MFYEHFLNNILFVYFLYSDNDTSTRDGGYFKSVLENEIDAIKLIMQFSDIYVEITMYVVIINVTSSI